MKTARGLNMVSLHDEKLSIFAGITFLGFCVSRNQSHHNVFTVASEYAIQSNRLLAFKRMRRNICPDIMSQYIAFLLFCIDPR